MKMPKGRAWVAVRVGLVGVAVAAILWAMLISGAFHGRLGGSPVTWLTLSVLCPLLPPAAVAMDAGRPEDYSALATLPMAVAVALANGFLYALVGLVAQAALKRRAG